MLTLAQYTSLWTAPYPGGFNMPLAAMPPYNDYVIRENQLQDYLDIFRGVNTRGHRPIIPAGGWYYDHPFAGMLNPENPPRIRYVAIAESALPSIPPVNNPDGTYVYNIYHNGATLYFSQPCSAFGIGALTKINKLFALANEGYLMLDLFMFSIKYTTNLRNRLNRHGVTTFFWNGRGVPQSIENRINTIRIEGLFFEADNFNYPKMALIAPPKISHYLADLINNPLPLPTYGLQPRMGHNILSTPSPIDGCFFNVPPPNIFTLNHVYQLDGIMRVPMYACTCYNGANMGPSSHFIRSAFCL